MKNTDDWERNLRPWSLADIGSLRFSYGYHDVSGSRRRLFAVRFEGMISENSESGQPRFVEAVISCGLIGFDASALLMDFREVRGLNPLVLEVAVHAARDPVTSDRLPLALLLPECAFSVQEVLTNAFQRDVRMSDYVAADVGSAVSLLLSVERTLNSSVSEFRHVSKELDILKKEIRQPE